MRMPEFTVISDFFARWQLSARCAAIRASSSLTRFWACASALSSASLRATAGRPLVLPVAAGLGVGAGASVSCARRALAGLLKMADSGTDCGGGLSLNTFRPVSSRHCHWA